MSSSLRKKFIRTLELLSIALILLNSSTAFAGFLTSGTENLPAGRPRFSKKKSSTLYIGMGVGMNPFDKITDIAGLGLSSAIISDLEHARGGLPSTVPVTGMPALVFGFVPDTAQFLRNNLELSFKISPININASNSDPVSIAGTNYAQASVDTFNLRLLYELYFQTVPKRGRLAFFLGGGMGFASNIITLKGTDATTTSSTSTVSTTTDVNATSTNAQLTIASNTSFSMAFTASTGVAINVTKGFAVELKVRYLALMTPFGNAPSKFDLYRHSVEIGLNVLVKI